MEKIVKGFANHNRVKILELLSEKPELSVLDISEKLKIEYENASDHVRKLASSSLVMKRNAGPSVLHKLTARGESILMFCKRLQ